MRSGSVLETELGEKSVIPSWLGEVALLGRYWPRKRSIERFNRQSTGSQRKNGAL